MTIEKLKEQAIENTVVQCDGFSAPKCTKVVIGEFMEQATAAGLSLIETEELEQLRADSWQDISTAPDDGTSVMLGCDYDRMGKQRVTLAWWDKRFTKSEVSGSWIEGAYYDVYEDRWEPMRVDFRPTHWRPLPTPPHKG